jgi:hypothetical protein
MATASPLQIIPAHNLPHPEGHGSAYQVADTSTAALSIPRGDAVATLNFFKDPEDGSAPFNYVQTPPEGQPQRNYGDFYTEVMIHDIRGHESDYNLDKDAFSVVSGVAPSAERDFISDESIEKYFYPEVEKLILENVPGSSRVVIFDHTIRRTGPDAPRSPVMRVHIDQTAAAAKERVRLHLGDESEELLKGRYRIINVWRPLNGPVLSFPLGFASSLTVEDSDVVPVQHRYTNRTGQTAGIRYNPGQRWHYLSEMRNDERLLLECFDSEALKEGSAVQGGRVPHTAFIHSRTPEGAVGRESIEVRALVFGS